MNLFSLVGPASAGVVAAQEGGTAGLAINFFWIIVASLNFIVFAVILYLAFGKQVSRLLAGRRERIEQGLRDAEQARSDRERAEQERLAALTEARREANEILARAQKVAQETRDADIAATREELERMRVRASEEIEAEKTRALGELRAEVADLAIQAAQKVIRETMTDQRQRRLVEEFLAEPMGTPMRHAGEPGAGGLMPTRQTTAARRYAEAALELANRDAAVDACGDGLELAASRVGRTWSWAFCATRRGRCAERTELVRTCSAKVPKPVVRTVQLLVERGRIDRLASVAAEFRRLVNRERGIVTAVATVAAP